MAWQELGTVNLSYEWQFLAVPTGNCGLFRITQLYSDTDYIHGKIVIAQVFNEPKEYYNYRAIFPSRNQKLVKLLPPLELIKDNNLTFRYLAFKFDQRYYRYSIGWQIQIEFQDAVLATVLELEDMYGRLIEVQSDLGGLQYTANRIEAKIDSIQASQAG